MSRNSLLNKFNVLLLATGIIIVAITVFVIRRHGDHFTQLATVLLYTSVSLAIALLAIAIFVLSQKSKRRVFIAFFSTFVMFYAIDATLFVLLTCNSSGNPPLEAAQKLGIAYDTRRVSEVVTDLRKNGEEAYPALPSAIYFNFPLRINGKSIIPLGGISNTREVIGNECGEYIIPVADEHGFHNPKGIWNNPKIQIAVVGDSYVHGYAVKSDENFTSLIRRQYPYTINLGRNGNSSLRELAIFNEYAAKLKPKVVLWCYCGANDKTELEWEKTCLILLQYLRSDFNFDLIGKQREIDEGMKTFLNGRYGKLMENMSQLRQDQKVEHYTKGLRDIIKLRHVRSKLGLIFDSPFDTELLGRILHQVDTTTRSFNGKLYFVYLPTWHRYGAPSQASPYRDQVLNLVRDLNIPVIDIHEAFSKHPDVLSLFPFRVCGHYNANGHKVVANAILKVLQQQGVSITAL